jgi:hypothetical protein
MRIPSLCRAALLVGALAVGLGGVGCTTNEFNYYYPGTGGTVLGADPVSGTIGQEGGSLRVTDPANPAFGAEISVPPDAVAKDVDISISPEATVDIPVAGNNLGQAGPVIGFDPPDLAALGPKFRIAVPAPLHPTSGRLVLLHLRSGTWEPVMGSGEGRDGTVIGEVDGLGLFVAGILGGGPPAPDTMPPVFAGLESVVAGPGSGQLTLSWPAATDETTAPGALVYYVWTSPVPGDPDPSSTPIAITDPGAQSIIVALGSSFQQKFLVRARDEAGNFDTNTKVVIFPSP